MRVYVPLTFRDLEAAHAARELAPAPLVAYAVTPALREWCGTEDQEELEYTALGRAARASLRLLAALTEPERGDPRRVVAAADVSDELVEAEVAQPLDPEGLGEVRLSRAVPLKRVAALHIDDSDAAGDLAEACGAQPAADRGEAQALSIVEDAVEHELLWYGVQELDQLVRP
ncbi:hypothetical protein JGS22_013860 [Streptomyces sp. P38-E01]|uniref:Uncharacterized protein n=1 Tax=Streptomyces tardus TaxID=2780544 RepID=A0A949N284_9ACTN|nr:hypothetical protein [Streptomyces tardus]MBU7598670.1 hypothetical protein [Streptomyces tardus]